MKKTDCLAERRRKSVSGVSVDPTEAGVAGLGVGTTEPFLVRRLSSRSVQLPPLAFRQAQQAYYDLTPPRPTSLPLWVTPLIAITTADTCSMVKFKFVGVKERCNETRRAIPRAARAFRKTDGSERTNEQVKSERWCDRSAPGEPADLTVFQ
ncbi:hypothetical protein SKAU_G00016210 [Synaphobranchus kaupii]|uniref:Uncharacterized protein n=1 Tax=Synaphobranchus kaupii TaxID=118154 RepID=A0A9Q1GC06_SYNKA|nr:hypothetical protein SKAU_G00016210 [Synaphobranchus kaupii]